MNGCFVVALNLLFVVPSFAQDESEAGFLLLGLKTRFGIILGANFSTASIDPEPTTAPGGSITKSGRTDVIVALPLEVRIARAVSVRVEPTYMQYGYTLDDRNSFFSSTTKVRRNYVEFPTLLVYNFGGANGFVEPYGFFGGVFGFRFCSDETFLSSYNIPGYERPATSSQVAAGPTDVREFTSKFNFGITFGGGAEYALSNRVSLSADVRYMLGLTNTYRKPDTVTLPPNTVEPNVKLRGFQIRVGGMYSL